MSLATQVTYAERFVGGDYTAKTTEELTAALDHAKAVLADESFVEPVITDAWHRLGNAVANRVDLASLRSAHGAAMPIGGYYTWSSRQVHQSALTQAKNILDAAKSADYDTTQWDVNAAKDELIAARNALIDLGAVRTVALAGPMTNVDFTHASWTHYRSALDVALDLLNRSAGEYHTTQANVDAIRVALSSAKNSLVDLSKLREKSLAPFDGEYTYSTYRAYSDVLSAANDILDQKDDPAFVISQADVNAVIAELARTHEELVDFTGLRRAYNDTMALNSDGYLTHSWSEFLAARTEAGRVLGAGEPTAAEVATATQNLTDAKQALTYNMGLHNVITEAGLRDETLYGAATWARFAAAVAVLEDLAARDLAGDPVTGSEVSDALNIYYPAMYGLLEMAPLRAASEDFASLNANHFARVAFTELAAITAAIDRVIADAADPAKIGMPGDQFMLPRYWAKKGELADIRALTAAFQRIDVINHSKHTAYSVDQLRSARHEAKTVVDTLWVTDSGVQNLLDQLAELEAALVSVTPLENSLAAAAALDERHYKADRWSELAARVATAKLLLTATADPNVPVTSTEILSAAQAITETIDKLEAAPPVITVGGLPVKDGQSIQAGTRLTIAGEQLEAGSMFRAELHSTPTLLGSVTAGPHGTAVLNVRIPASTPAGSHTLHVFGTAANGSAIHHTVAVTVAGAAGPSKLPRTGTDLTPLYAGGGFMVAGALLVLIKRRYAVR